MAPTRTTRTVSRTSALISGRSRACQAPPPASRRRLGRGAGPTTQLRWRASGGARPCCSRRPRSKLPPQRTRGAAPPRCCTPCSWQYLTAARATPPPSSWRPCAPRRPSPQRPPRPCPSCGTPGRGAGSAPRGPRSTRRPRQRACRAWAGKTWRRPLAPSTPRPRRQASARCRRLSPAAHSTFTPTRRGPGLSTACRPAPRPEPPC
mmetsp:Transcript_3708/g.15415  ORF Transcript_3708/g.15415 Transcript_3708/m.15415 type:complete len:206 (-) Transcript_3708:5733-6350(-)